MSATRKAKEEQVDDLVSAFDKLILMRIREATNRVSDYEVPLSETAQGCREELKAVLMGAKL